MLLGFTVPNLPHKVMWVPGDRSVSESHAWVLQELDISAVLMYAEERPTVPVWVHDMASWVEALLRGASNLEFLAIDTVDLPCPPVLSSLPLRHLALMLTVARRWLCSLMADLAQYRHLASAEIVYSPFPDDPHYCCCLPELRLQSLTSLRRLELQGCSVKGQVQLPADCLLRLDDICRDVKEEFWRKQWEQMRTAVSVLRLSHVTNILSTWPGGIHQCAFLKHCKLGYWSMHLEDVAVLKHTPHVKLLFTRGHQSADLRWMLGKP